MRFQVTAHTPNGSFVSEIAEGVSAAQVDNLVDAIYNPDLDRFTLRTLQGTSIYLTGQALSNTVFEVFFEDED